MQRINRHQRDRGRAIGVGNKTAMFFYVLPVDLWNDQRDLRIHSEYR